MPYSIQTERYLRQGASI